MSTHPAILPTSKLFDHTRTCLVCSVPFKPTMCRKYRAGYSTVYCARCGDTNKPLRNAIRRSVRTIQRWWKREWASKQSTEQLPQALHAPRGVIDDGKFDWCNLSPSPPVAMQRDYTLAPLTQPPSPARTQVGPLARANAVSVPLMKHSSDLIFPRRCSAGRNSVFSSPWPTHQCGLP